MKGNNSRETSLKALWASLALVLLTVAVFAPVIHFQFLHWDDGEYVVDNARVQQGITWENVRWAFTTASFGFYYPLTWLSHMLDCSLFGLWAGGHHLTSLLIHVANVLLLFALLKAMTSRFWISLCVAALFAVHPLNVESVCWISERKNILSTFFWFLALLAYAWYVKKPSKGRYGAMALFYLFGLMAKSMLVTFPFGLLLLDWWPLNRWNPWTQEGRRKLRKVALEKIPLLMPIPIFAWITVVAQKEISAVGSLQAFPMADRLAGAVLAYCRYLRQMAWPSSLAALYPHLKGNWSGWEVALAVFFLAGVTALVLAKSKRRPYFAVGWLWFLGTLVPVIGIVQVGGQASADRYMYVPMVGLLAALAWGASEVPLWGETPRVARVALFFLVISPLAVAARLQAGTWRDNFTFFTIMVERQPQAYLGQYNMGNYYREAGELDKAIACYSRAIAIDPARVESWTNMGIALEKAGRKQEALDAFTRARDLKPDSGVANFNLGDMQEIMGFDQQAMESYLATLRANPAHEKALLRATILCARLGREQEGVKLFRDHKKLPVPPGANQDSLMALGIQCNLLEMWPEARAMLAEALNRDPSDADGWSLLGLCRQKTKDYAAAAQAYREALRIRPNMPRAWFNLGVACLQANDRAGAIQAATGLQAIDPAIARRLEKLIASRGPNVETGTNEAK